MNRTSKWKTSSKVQPGPAGQSRRAAVDGNDRKVHFETFENRFLLAADPLAIVVAQALESEAIYSDAGGDAAAADLRIDLKSAYAKGSVFNGAIFREASSEPMIAIIDSAVLDREYLTSTLPDGTDVFVLDPNLDGVAEIASIMQDKSNIGTMWVFAHGAEGMLHLGNVALSSDSIKEYSPMLGNIGRALSDDGDLLVFSCDLAAGAVGRQFVEELARYTGADVAASTNKTGGTVFGGDGILEAVVGEVDATWRNWIGLHDYPRTLGASAEQVATAFRQPLGDGVLTEAYDPGVGDDYMVPVDSPAVYDGGNFGAKRSKEKQDTFHLAEDWSAESDRNEYGDPVFAIANGRVTQSGDLSDPADPFKETLGQYVVIAHQLPEDGQLFLDGAWRTEIVSLYAHLGARSVSVGDFVWMGDVIGRMGNSGTGAIHLHHEIRVGTEFTSVRGYEPSRSDPEGWIDPTNFLRDHYATVSSENGVTWKIAPPIAPNYGPVPPIRGTSGNDVISAGALDDMIDGGGGDRDVLLLPDEPGKYELHRESRTVGDPVVVIDGPYGTDVATSVEILRFVDTSRDIDVSAMPIGVSVSYESALELSEAKKNAQVAIAEKGNARKILDPFYFGMRQAFGSTLDFIKSLSISLTPASPLFDGTTPGVKFSSPQNATKQISITTYGFKEFQLKGLEVLPESVIHGLALEPRLRDDHGATNESATPVTVAPATTHTRISGVIGSKDDVDRFSIALEGGERYEISATSDDGGLRPVVRLWNATGIAVAEGHSIENSGSAFLSYRVQTTGTFYVDVSASAGTTGSYVVVLTNADAESGALLLQPKPDSDSGGNSPVNFLGWIGTPRGDTYTWTSNGPAHLRGGDGDDTITGGNGKGNVDVIYGDAGDDSLRGKGGVDFLYGGPGNDYLDGGASDDVLHGESGDDELRGGDGNDYLHGWIGHDYLRGGDGNDLLKGGEDDDDLGGGNGNDEMYGDEGRDELSGNDGDDILVGGTGGDTLDGGDGDDRLEGQDGNDVLFGGAGSDILLGGAGDDLLQGGQGQNVIDGGQGNDTVSFLDVAPVSAVVVNLWDGKAVTLPDPVGVAAFGPTAMLDDRLDVLIEIENVHGSNQSDRIDGNPFANVLYGNAGDDVLRGHAGDDTLSGDSGDDIVWGDDGNDHVFGGNGSDDVRGGLGNDITDGGDGNDTLRGEQGDDLVDGGAGTDRVVFWGNRNDFEITRNADGSYTVADLRSESPEGIDNVRNVEVFSFFSGDINESDIISMAPLTTDDIISTDAGDIVVVDALRNDLGQDGGALMLVGVSSESQGAKVYVVGTKVVVDPNGAFSHLKSGERAQILVSYTVANKARQTTEGKIHVDINGTGDPASAPRERSSNPGLLARILRGIQKMLQTRSEAVQFADSVDVLPVAQNVSDTVRTLTGSPTVPEKGAQEDSRRWLLSFVTMISNLDAVVRNTSASSDAAVIKTTNAVKIATMSNVTGSTRSPAVEPEVSAVISI